MRLDTRTTIHMGINFVVVPGPEIDKRRYLEFQRALVAQGIDYSDARQGDNQVEIVREKTYPLSIIVKNLPPQPVGQVAMIAPRPARELRQFVDECEEIVTAYRSTWPTQQLQVVSCDASLRDLYQSTADHAFRELWETGLGQKPESLASLGHPVLGGGVRFVMPALPSDPDPAEIDVKIESYLKNTRQFFVEIRFRWIRPSPADDGMSPRKRLNTVDDYVEQHLLAFLKERLP